jgi:UDP-GlcNAc:undecaprenyl-phosphate GlcNAc-1-phosphate transferase
MINIFIIIELFIVSFLSIYILDKLANSFNIIDRPNKHKIHKKKTTKIAGVGLIFIILNSFIIYDYNYELGYSFTILILFILVGFYDDLKQLNASSKIILMIIPIVLYIQEAGLVIKLGEYNGSLIQLKSFSFIFTLCCILLLTNAYNYIDGMDGLLGTITSVSLIFYFIFLPKNESFILIPFIVFTLTFLLFNLGIFKRLPKVFIGDSGSIGIGFLFSIIIIHFTQNKIYIHESVAIWPIAFVVYEFLTINIIRIKNKKNPLSRDLGFIFNKMLKKYGKIQTLFYCNLINLFFCIIGYFIFFTEKFILSIFLFIIMFFIYFMFRLKQDKI